MSKYLELAEKLERAKSQWDFNGQDQADFCAAFGVRQEMLHRAGWKRWYPGSRRWGSSLRPLSSLDDLRSLLEHAGHLPDMLPSCPWKAAAASLRSLDKRGY